MKIKLNDLGSVLVVVFLLFINAACGKLGPYMVDRKLAIGYVIGKEFCHTDETKDYWLIDLTYLQDAPQYGDTLVLNGIKYVNVVKTKDLLERFKKINMKVHVQFKVISENKMETTGCSIANSVTYNLKELFIIDQGETQ